MKRLIIITLICMSAVAGARFFVSPLLSMKAVGEARNAARSTYDDTAQGDAQRVAIADAVEASLHRSHRVWQVFDSVLDAIMLVTALIGLFRLAARARVDAGE